MKYLDSAPFNSQPANDKYRDNWERIFGGNKKDKKKKNEEKSPSKEEKPSK